MTIIRCEYDNQIWDLDVLEQQPIRVDISAIENDSIGEVFGASSQQFTLPGSKKNNRFFKHAYKVGVTGVPGLGESVRASVITNSNVLLQGSLFLEEVVRTEIDGINYNVVIVNDVVSFNESVKTVAIKDLNWSELDHNFTVQNITSSWDGSITNVSGSVITGSVYYPLIDMGRDGKYNTGSLPDIAIDPNTPPQLGFINNETSSIKENQFTPAIQVKTLLDKIFEQGGFTYSSSLTPLFEQLYVLPKQTEDLSVKGTGFTDYGFIAGASIDQTIDGDNTYVAVQMNTEQYDPNNGYNPSTYIFTAPATGQYTFTSSIDYELEGPEDTSPIIKVRVRNLTTNTTIGSIFYEPTTITGSFTLPETTPVILQSGSQVQLQAAYQQGTGQGLLTISIMSSSFWQTDETPINWASGVIQVGEQFEPQTKCIDVLKGLIEKFNLVIEPIYTENKVLKIESFNDWIASGDKKDWTQKVEQAKRIGLRHPLSSQPKTLIFEDAKDNDKLSKQVIDNAEGYQWGTEIIDAVSDVPQGERKVGSFFAPVILEAIPGGGSTQTIPQLYKTDDTQQQRKTFKFKPRLGYKLNRTLNATAYLGNESVPFTQYATISNYNTNTVISGSTLNLHYNDTFYTPTFTTTTGSITAYDRYWSNYIVDLYEDDNRILNLDLEFTPEELQDIALNDKIFVEDTIYRINKISGYNLVSPDVVNVELIKVKDYTTTTPVFNCNFDFIVEAGAPATTTTTTTTTTAAPTFTYYLGDKCEGEGQSYFRTTGSLQIGEVVTLAGTTICYEIISEGGFFGFDFDDVYVDCPTCLSASASTTTTTTTQPPTTTVSGVFSYISVYDAGNGLGGPGGSNCCSPMPYTILIDEASLLSISSGSRAYQSPSQVWVGGNKWYGIGNTGDTQSTRSILVDNNGIIGGIALCSPCQPATTTIAPAEVDLYIRNLIGSEAATLYYTVNGGPQQTAFIGALDTNCSLRRENLGPFNDGDILEFYTDELENIAGAVGSGTCPTSVGGSTSYITAVVAGNNSRSITIDTGATTTTTSTTTLPPVTQIYTDATPGNGNLDSCGCEEGITQFNIQVLGSNVDITQDMTGKTIYSNWNMGTLFVGDNKWYCIATSNGVVPQYSIQIDNFGEVTDWAQSVPCTTTTTTTEPPATLEVDGKTLVSSFVSVQYTVNQGATQTLYEQTLGTSCQDLGTITGLVEGDVVDIFEGSTDFIAGALGAGTCPASVGSSTAYQITVSAGTNQVSITINTGATTTTTLPPQFTDIYTDATPGNGNLDSCGCEEGITQFNIQVGGENVDITQDMTGKTIYSNFNTGTLFVGDDKWYCIATSNGVVPQYSIQINNSGIVTDWTASSPCTTTTTTTEAPATLEVDGRTLVSSFVGMKYTINQGAEQTLYENTLGTSCISLGTITGLVAGDVVDIYEDSSDTLAGALGAGTCPASVGGSTIYQVVVSAGLNQASITINTGATTTTTSTTTTTLPQVTQIYSDATPGNGNLDSCGCEQSTTQFNIQVLGNNVNINQDMTGDTIYSNYGTGTLFVGDNKWYCIATSNGVTPTISIQINNSGIVIDWAQSQPCPPPPTTTTTTTLDPNGCYEWEVECLNIGGTCQLNYVDCYGDSQTETIPEGQPGLICARPTPTMTQGSVVLQGTCIPPSTTTSTTTTTTIVWNSAVAAYSAISNTDACTRYCTGQGPNSTVYWIGAGVSFGNATVLYGLPDGFSQVPNGFYAYGGDWVFASAEQGPPGSPVIQSGTCTPCPSTTTTTTGAPTTTTTAPPPQSWFSERNDTLATGYITLIQGYNQGDEVLVDDNSGICWTLGELSATAGQYNITGPCPPPTTTTTQAPSCNAVPIIREKNAEDACCNGISDTGYFDTNSVETATIYYGTTDCSTPFAFSQYFAVGGNQYYQWVGGVMSGPFTCPNCP